jgi:hypothetical protein
MDRDAPHAVLFEERGLKGTIYRLRSEVKGRIDKNVPFTYTYLKSGGTTGRESMTDLCVVSGPDGKIMTYPVEGEVLYVGRSTSNDIQVSDGFVSRKHLKIIRKGERFFIKDLFSKNGTFVRGEWITPGMEYPLSEGSPVVIGMSVLCLGKGCSEEMLSLLESAPFAGETLSGPDRGPDRPSTSQNTRALVSRICDDMTQTLDLHEMLKRVLDHIFEVFFRVERGAIILLDAETGWIREAVTRSKQGAGPLQYSMEVVKRVFQQREAVMISDAEAEQSEGDLPETLKLLNIKSVMCVPLTSHSKLLGVLYADSVTKPYGFRGEDLYLLSSLGSPLAAAIENALTAPAR